MSEKCQGSVRDLPGTDPTPETSPTDVSVFRPERMEHLFESSDEDPRELNLQPTLRGDSREPTHSERSEGPRVPGCRAVPGDPAGLREDRPWDDEWEFLDCYRGGAPNHFGV